MERTAQALDIPVEATGLPRVEVTGRHEVRMENHKGILAYGREEIIVSGGKELAHNVIEQEKENMRDYLRSLGDKILECEKEAYPYV